MQSLLFALIYSWNWTEHQRRTRVGTPHAHDQVLVSSGALTRSTHPNPGISCLRVIPKLRTVMLFRSSSGSRALYRIRILLTPDEGGSTTRERVIPTPFHPKMSGEVSVLERCRTQLLPVLKMPIVAWDVHPLPRQYDAIQYFAPLRLPSSRKTTDSLSCFAEAGRHRVTSHARVATARPSQITLQHNPLILDIPHGIVSRLNFQLSRTWIVSS